MKRIVRDILLVIRKLRYAIVFVLGFVIVTFVDEYSVMRYFQLRSEISNTRDEIDKYRTQYEHDTRKLRELRHNGRAVEKVARELYYMKTDDEDVFVLSDDPREATNLMNNPEAAE